MTLQLGAYEVLAPSGAGGMGEVYKARDTRLGRLVALKVLPDSLASGRDRAARFERAAKLLASLPHPRIALLFFPEESGSANYFRRRRERMYVSDSQRGTRGAGACRQGLVQRAQRTSRVVPLVRPDGESAMIGLTRVDA